MAITEENTPSTKSVADVWAFAFVQSHGTLAEGYASFDRWLAAHDAQVREEASPWLMGNGSLRTSPKAYREEADRG